MQVLKQGVLRGLFRGFDGPGTIFEFSDGERWRQLSETVQTHRAFMPDARIVYHKEKYFLEIESIRVSVQVAPTL